MPDDKPRCIISWQTVEEIGVEMQNFPGVQFINRDLASVFGIPTKIVRDQDEIERAELCICGSPTRDMPKDNIVTACWDCGCPLTHRPHAPKAAPKCCLRCALRRLERLEK